MSSGLPKAVETAIEILDTHRFFASGEGPSRMKERIERVVEVLEATGIEWVLVGAHAVGELTEPRATEDFDFVVDAGGLRGLLEALERELGDLDAEEMGPAVRLRTLAVDLIRSTNHPLFAAALEHVRRQGGWRLPAPEVLIALKFLSAVSPWRGAAKRTYDMGDLRAIVQAVGSENLDRELLLRLGGLVYPGAEAELAGLLGRIERGEPIAI